jgi:hypothetical protein
VNEVEVDVVEAKVGERSAARKLHVLSCHVRAPQFARHPQVLARAHAFGDCRADPFAHLLFVAVITCAVNVAVPVPHTGKALVLTGLCARTIGALMDHHGHLCTFHRNENVHLGPTPTHRGPQLIIARRRHARLATGAPLRAHNHHPFQRLPLSISMQSPATQGCPLCTRASFHLLSKEQTEQNNGRAIVDAWS